MRYPLALGFILVHLFLEDPLVSIYIFEVGFLLRDSAAGGSPGSRRKVFRDARCPLLLPFVIGLVFFF